MSSCTVFPPMRKIKERTFKRGFRTFKRFPGLSGQLGPSFNRFQINDTQAFVPEIWAQEAVRTLNEQMLWSGLVHRDFEDEIAQFGETVHTRKVGEFKAKRKQNDLDAVVEQDATATDIEVKLNQRIYVSFIIGDGEQSKSFKDLVATYLEPAMTANARMLDRIVALQAYQFLSNRAGGLGLASKTTVSDYMLDLREVFNVNKVPLENRWLGLASPTETHMQKVEMFKKADEIGDAGTALRNALLGRLHGFNSFLELNTPSVRGATTATATTTTAAASAGATVIAMTSVAALPVGAYFTVAGDMTPLRVSAVNTLNVTSTRPLLRAIAGGAAVQPYATGLIKQDQAIAKGQTHAAAADGYPVNWMKEIRVDGTGVPKQGQLVSFAAAGTPNVLKAAEYGIVEVTDVGGGVYDILLDRPLVDAVADDDIVCYGPSGDYNFALQRNAIALVNRPLALPMQGTGVRSATGFLSGLSMRVTITYDGSREGTRVTFGALLGIAKLQDELGGVMLG